jgi:hypothetical protein
MSPEERAEHDRHVEATLRLLQERRAYHQAKIAEERERRDAEERRRELSLLRRLRRLLAA